MPVLVHLSAMLFSGPPDELGCPASHPRIGFPSVHSLGGVPGWCCYGVWLPCWHLPPVVALSMPSSLMDALLGLRCGGEPYLAIGVCGCYTEFMLRGIILPDHRLPWDILSRSSFGAILRPLLVPWSYSETSLDIQSLGRAWATWSRSETLFWVGRGGEGLAAPGGPLSSSGGQRRGI